MGRVDRKGDVALATTKKTSTGNTRKAAEIKAKVKEAENESMDLLFKKAQEVAMKIKDPNRTDIKNIIGKKRQEIREYLQNPASNENNLIVASRYLYYRTQIYFRLVNFYANMFDLRCRQVIPNYNLTKTNNDKKILKQLNETLTWLDNYGIHDVMLPALTTVFREDVYYGIFYRDDTGSILYPLDPSFCKIDGIYSSHDYSYSVNMSKFRSQNMQELLQWLGDPLLSMYKEYERTKEQWQHMDDRYAACFKFRTDDLDHVLPPLMGIFQELATRNDRADLQAIADELDVYKLLLIPMETISGTKRSDDFQVSPQILLDYYNVMMETFPDYVGAAVIPANVTKDNVLDFSSSSSDNDIDRLEQSDKTLLGTSGGGAVLNANMITSTAAFKAWLKSESEFAISPLLPQIKGFTNRMLKYDTANPCTVDYFEVSIYTKEDVQKTLLESCQYGFSNKLAYNTFNGISEKTTISMMYLENNILNMPQIMIPLSSSYTQTTGDVGRPEVSDDELSTSGERSRNE